MGTDSLSRHESRVDGQRKLGQTAFRGTKVEWTASENWDRQPFVRNQIAFVRKPEDRFSLMRKVVCPIFAKGGLSPIFSFPIFSFPFSVPFSPVN